MSRLSSMSRLEELKLHSKNHDAHHDCEAVLPHSHALLVTLPAMDDGSIG